MLSFASKPLLWTLRASLLEAVDVAVEAGVPRVPSRASRSRQRRLLRVPSLRAQVVVSPRGIFQMIGTKRSGLSGMLQVIGTKRSGLSGMLQLSGPKRSGLNGRRDLARGRVLQAKGQTQP